MRPLFVVIAFLLIPLARASHIPAHFIKNCGQGDKRVHFYVKSLDKTLYFTSNGIAISSKNWTVALDFMGANPNVEPEGRGRMETAYHFFKGPEARWITNVQSYAGLVYKELWPGIDLVYSGAANKVKYYFVVKPNANPELIRFRCRGATDLGIDEHGRLRISTPAGSILDQAPLACQGEHEEVLVKYEVHEASFVYGFHLGEYDPEKTLVIDPAILVYCGFLGGDFIECGHDIAIDKDGFAYVTGQAHSTPPTFPEKVGPDLSHNGSFDAFIAKVSQDGRKLIYCGYIGGVNDDIGYGVEVDAQGAAYVTGASGSTELTFPVRVGPNLNHSGGWDAFIAKVRPDGSDLEYCGYIGGENHEASRDIALDNAGNAYLTGYTDSDEKTFPIINGPDQTLNGGIDAFVAKVTRTGAKLEFCGYLGGKGFDWVNGLALDGQGNIYLTGETSSNESSFPVITGPDLSHNGAIDGFAAKLTPDGSKIIYCGYLGGSLEDRCWAIQVNDQGEAYLAGDTESNESSFPVKHGPDLFFNGMTDGFAAKVNASGTDLEFCGYLGGASTDFIKDLALDSCSNLYVTGFTLSNETSFPVCLGPDLTHNGSQDAFVARIVKDGGVLEFCGYVGGVDVDFGEGLSVDANGCLYLAGWTESDAVTFPVLKGPDLTYNGCADVFISKLEIIMPLEADTKSLSATQGGEVRFALNAGVIHSKRNYFLFGGYSGKYPGISLPGGQILLPLNWDPLTQLILLNKHPSIFQDFTGQLDSAGKAAAKLKMRPNSNLWGLNLVFAYGLNNPWDFVSNAVMVEIQP